MKSTVAVEDDIVVIDVPGPSAAAFSLSRSEARELALAILDAVGSTLKPEALAEWTDEEVRKAWMESDWTPGEANADALAAEMVERGLDF